MWLDSFMAIFGLYRKPVPRQKRICQRCNQPIKRNHCFTHLCNGKTEHWSCENPTESPKRLAKALKQIPVDEQQVLPFEGEGDI